MKSSYDPEVDALYVILADGPVKESEEVSPGIVFDYDAAGRIVSIEILNARSRLAEGAIPAATAAE